MACKINKWRKKNKQTNIQGLQNVVGVFKKRQRPPFIAYFGRRRGVEKKWKVQFYFQCPHFLFCSATADRGNFSRILQFFEQSTPTLLLNVHMLLDAQILPVQKRIVCMSAVHSPPKSMKIVLEEWKLPTIFLHVPKRQKCN